MSRRVIPLRRLLAVTLFAGFASVTRLDADAQANSVQAANPSVVGVWQRVVLAQSASQQANEVNGFLRALATEGRRPADLTLDARDIASGRAVAADDPALLQRPQAHEVTLTLDGRFYVFRPLSRASIEPLLRR